MATLRHTFKGLLHTHPYTTDAPDSDDVLYLTSIDEPLAEYLRDNFVNKCVSVRYWIGNSDYNVVKTCINGNLSAEFGAVYSEISGFLWMNEEVCVGGHDLIDEFKFYIGKWLILQIDVHDKEDSECQNHIAKK